MSKPKNKPKLVEKVSAETQVPVEDLERLPVEALEKLDEMTEDTEEFPEIEPEFARELEAIENEMTEAEVLQEVVADVFAYMREEGSGEEAEHHLGEKVFLGYHPCSLEKVYKE